MKENIRLVCFDVDDTLIEQNSWERLNTALGITPEEDQAMYRQYKNGEISYAQWQERLEVLYKERGLVSEELVKRVLTTFTFKPGAKELIHYLQEAGYEIALISGSFSQLVEAIAGELGVKHYFGTDKLLLADTEMPLKLIHNGNQGSAKLSYLQGLVTDLSISIEECACIADGANDRPMFEATGKGITFSYSPVADIAWKTIDRLKEVQDIL